MKKYIKPELNVEIILLDNSIASSLSGTFAANENMGYSSDTIVGSSDWNWN